MKIKMTPGKLAFLVILGATIIAVAIWSIVKYN